jgi:5-methylcytosine-specific restriction endonuclease McrA
VVGGRVLVLNATYEPINVCTVRRAVVLLLKEKAEMLEQGRWELHSETTAIPRPTVIRLVSYVRVPRDAHRRKITRRAVFARDDWSCQYCGARSNLTVDHVIPRSKGGPSDWENIVASCAPCNRRKGDRMPAQADMHPRRAPRVPHAEIFIHVSSPTIPTAWLAYLPNAA